MRKKMNKRQTLTLVLASIMVLGSVMGPMSISYADTVAGKGSTATTGTTPIVPIKGPVKEVKLSDAAQRLVALGIVQGREDGNIDAQSNITRAEVTAIILRAMGLKSSNYTFKQTFNDVPETAWYAKDLTIAKELGLIFGVGDNKFAPEKNVSNAELITILVRALGYEKTTTEKVNYPIFHIMKAQESGILKNVTADLNTISLREDMFVLIDNALQSKVLEANAYGMYAPGNATMMEKYLGVKNVKVQIVDSGSLLGGLEKGTVKIQGPFGKDGAIETKVITTENEALLNVENLFSEVELFMDKDGKIVFNKSVKALEMKTGLVEKVERFNNEDVIRFKDSTRNYKLSDNLIVVKNYEMTDARNLRSLLEGSVIKYTLENDKIAKIIVENVRDVSVFKELKDNTLEMVSGSRIKLKDMTSVTVYINGVKSEIKDLKFNDLIYSFEKGKEIIIKVNRNTVEGKLTSVGRINSIVKIDAKEYNLSKTFKMSVDNGKSLTVGMVEDLVGETVLAYLNDNSEIELLIGNVDTKLESIYVIDRIVKDNISNSQISDFVSLIDTNGKLTNFTVDRKVNLTGLGRGDLVAVSFYDGSVNSILKATPAARLKYHTLVDLKAVSANNINVRGLTITQGNSVNYVKSVDVPVFMVNTRGIEVLRFDDLVNFVGQVNMSLVIRDRDVVAIYINDSNLQLEQFETKAVVLDMHVSTIDGKRATYVEVQFNNGDIVSYALDANVEVTAFEGRGYGKMTTKLTDINEGEIVSLVLNKQGVITRLHEVTLTQDLDLVNNIVKSVNRFDIKIGTKDYQIASDALIVDARGRIDVLRNPIDIIDKALVIFSMDKGKINNLVVIGVEGDNFQTGLIYETEFVTSVNALNDLVTRYKTTSSVKLSELNTLLGVAQTKLLLVQSKSAVALKITELGKLETEIAGLVQTNNTNAGLLRTALTTIASDLEDFKTNSATTVTETSLELALAEAAIKLANVKDKTVLVSNEAQTLANLTASFELHIQELEEEKLAAQLNEANAEIFRGLLSTLQGKLEDFMTNPATTITEVDMELAIENAELALADVTDKTVLILGEVQALADLISDYQEFVLLP